MEQYVEGLTCGAPLEEHLLDIRIAMGAVGVGGGCEDTYKALVELANAIRDKNNFRPYTPKGTAYVDDVLNRAQQILQNKKARQGVISSRRPIPSV